MEIKPQGHTLTQQAFVFVAMSISQENVKLETQYQPQTQPSGNPKKEDRRMTKEESSLSDEIEE